MGEIIYKRKTLAGVAGDAVEVNFDSTATNLEGNNVQDAIQELDANVQDAIQELDAEVTSLNSSLTNSLSSNGLTAPIEFGYDAENDVYGYIKAGADTVTPFSSDVEQGYLFYKGVIKQSLQGFDVIVPAQYFPSDRLYWNIIDENMVITGTLQTAGSPHYGQGMYSHMPIDVTEINTITVHIATAIASFRLSLGYLNFYAGLKSSKSLSPTSGATIKTGLVNISLASGGIAVNTSDISLSIDCSDLEGTYYFVLGKQADYESEVATAKTVITIDYISFE